MSREKSKLVTLTPYKSTLEDRLAELSYNKMHLAEARYPAGMRTIIDKAQTCPILLLKVACVKGVEKGLELFTVEDGNAGHRCVESQDSLTLLCIENLCRTNPALEPLP